MNVIPEQTLVVHINLDIYVFKEKGDHVTQCFALVEHFVKYKT